MYKLNGEGGCHRGGGTQYRPLSVGPESTESSIAGLSKAGMFHQTGVSFYNDQRFLSWIGK